MTPMSQSSLAARRGGSKGSSSPPSSSSPSLSRYFVMAAAVLLGLLVMVFVITSPSTKQQHHRDSKVLSMSRATESIQKSSSTSLVPNEIVLGEWNGETYYHCPANIATASTSGTNTKKQEVVVQDIVLWHGASFTKEEWKTSGILQQLCNVNHFSVTALDLSHRSNHQALVKLLHGLQNEQQLLTLPLAAIVTPSASGFGIVDWINQDTVDFVQSVQLWVPVACPATTQLNAKKMQQLKNNNNNSGEKFPVLAIHGDQDAHGKEQSIFLRDYMGAQVVEIHGRHPCYLDSPDAFVEALVKRLENERLKNSSQ